MKIDKVAGGHVPQTKLDQASRKPSASVSSKPVSEPALNANTAALDKAQADMAKLPDVDMAKVEQVRNALVKGELGLDVKSLSQAVMRFHTGHE
ncbi:flagellar biosynthesis anti-sigma factor FlgM [Vibrio sp. ZSDZ34]|jgi:negative regulator of flagellin synthesis FlgM|uniref:Flagellar biosynthesis anti-sigma factor FlgM n=1 Tax=Vibrio gelatinilyticus TaxID=2893468 RepID=A0A9X1WCU8_9VIBR|nr:flagellar biosynthesis anti-sigma factor FlgM [Vibrio gelatinilyticus]MCJ2378547.1 flagellar biosynthesis anti-sigma factor FlgM [Vibrio gelatinilyticus]